MPQGSILGPILLVLHRIENQSCENRMFKKLRNINRHLYKRGAGSDEVIHINSNTET